MLAYFWEEVAWTFLQVKEPEGFVDKSKKRGNTEGSPPAKRKRGKPDQTKSIKDFFKEASKDSSGPAIAGGSTILHLRTHNLAS